MPIPGFIGYEISEFGRIRSYRVRGVNVGDMCERPRRLTPCHDSYGYPLIMLRDLKGGSHVRTVHKLVALAFHGPRPDGMQLVRHLNGKKCDNHWTNLAYGTLQDNADDMMRLGEQFHGSQLKQSKLTESEVAEIHQRLRQGGRLAVIGREFNISPSAIASIRDGKTWWRVPCAV